MRKHFKSYAMLQYSITIWMNSLLFFHYRHDWFRGHTLIFIQKINKNECSLIWIFITPKLNLLAEWFNLNQYPLQRGLYQTSPSPGWWQRPAISVENHELQRWISLWDPTCLHQQCSGTLFQVLHKKYWQGRKVGIYSLI